MKKKKQTKDVDERTEKQKFLDDKAEVAYIRKHGINGKYDPSFDELDRHKELVAKHTKGTPQGMAERFRVHVGTLRTTANRLSGQPDNYQIKEFTAEDTYHIYLHKVILFRKIAKKYLNKDLPDAPKPPINNWRLGLLQLASWFDNGAAILGGIEAKAQTPDKVETTLQKKQAWDDSDPDYMKNTEAIINFTGSKLTLTKLNRTLNSPTNTIRFMQKGRRCKVHIGDFRAYAKPKYVSDELAETIADEVLADRTAMQETTKKSKRKTGK